MKGFQGSGKRLQDLCHLQAQVWKHIQGLGLWLGETVQTWEQVQERGEAGQT